MHEATSALALIDQIRPDNPVHCIRPHAARRAADWFVAIFPGDCLYAVKANPHPAVLDAVWAAGVRAFDVASPEEIATVAERFPAAKLAYMHPVKARSAIRAAYHDYGVRIFAVDTIDEIEKVRTETNDAKDLFLVVRLAVSSDYAAHKLAGKFGAAGREARDVLRHARAYAEELGVSFHVGSQCMRPEAWRVAMRDVGETIRAAGVTVDIVDVGGGFPAAYPGYAPPALRAYIDEIGRAFEEMPVLENADLWCEPGRALCAEAGSHIVRVEARKGDALYLNDGSYGALFDAAHCGMVYPTRLLRAAADGAGFRPMQAFRFYGPTCDSIDEMKGPFFLPEDVAEGDYIEIGQTGAYGAALATRFNGFGRYDEATLSDAPMLTMYDAGAEPAVAAARNVVAFRSSE